MNKTNNTVVNDNMIDDTKIGDDHDWWFLSIVIVIYYQWLE